MKPYDIRVGDSMLILKDLPAQSVQCVVTSPPYWGLRDYGTDGQLGLEATPEKYVENIIQVFREVRRVLRDDGTLWLNLGDTYAHSKVTPNKTRREMREVSDRFRAGGEAQAEKMGFASPNTLASGLKPKDLVGIPWRVAFALRADGWYLRSDIIWEKPNPMPESVTDRPTKAHEYIFLLTKLPKYYYDAEAVRETPTDSTIERNKYQREYKVPASTHPGLTSLTGNMKPGGDMKCSDTGRNARSVWTFSTQSYPEAHFATFPVDLPERCIKAGTSEKGCCPECGAPWDRIVERDRKATRPGINNVNDPTGMANRDPQRHVTETKTVGWRSTCDHRGDPVPCVVLDPFSGSGTTGEAACLLGRKYIGIELNAEYAAMSERRIGKALHPDTYRDMDAKVDAPLFQQ